MIKFKYREKVFFFKEGEEFMTKRERVLNAMNNRAVDRPPVSFWFHFPLDMDLDKDCVAAHLDYYRKTDIDFIKIMCDGFFDYPNPIIPTVTKPEDWYNMKPLGANHPFIRGQVERVKEIVQSLNGECMTFYNVFCPMSFFRFGTSEELLMSHLKENPNAVMHAFDVIAEDAITLSRLVIEEGGCDGIYYCVQNAEEFRFSFDEYRKLVTPSDLKVLEAANQYSEYNILHCCGWAGDKNRLEVWQDYPAKAFNWAVFVENMSMAEGKKFFGGKCVLGGFDNREEGVLWSGTEEEIKAFTKKWLAENKENGMIIGADCSLGRGMKLDNIKYVVDAVKGEL